MNSYTPTMGGMTSGKVSRVSREYEITDENKSKPAIRRVISKVVTLLLKQVIYYYHNLMVQNTVEHNRQLKPSTEIQQLCFLLISVSVNV